MPDAGEPAKLKVSFLGGLTDADYWILARDDEYRWCVTGRPDRTAVWILSRTPQLAPDILAALKQRATDLGYATAPLEMTLQPEQG